MTSHDQLAKNLIQTFFAEFLSLAAPVSAARLRPEEAAFLDKQSFTDFPQGDRREMDLLAEVPILGEDGRYVLVHTEIEARARPGMDQRLWGYYMQLRLRHGVPVLPILVNLRGGLPGVRLEVLEDEFDDPATALFRYRVWGISGCSAEEYLAQPEPLAWALAALMRPGRWSRAELKIECLRRIAGAKLPTGKTHMLVNWVETYLKLTGRDAVELEKLQALALNQEVRAMQMTWADKLEQKGFLKGRLKGRQEGRQEVEQAIQSLRRVVLRLLDQRFGSVPPKVQKKVEKISSMDRLTELAEKVFAVQSLDEMGLK